MTDLDTILACNLWELDAILEGLESRQADEAELLAKHAFDLRYTLNSKKAKFEKIFDRNKLNRKIKLKYGKGNKSVSSNKHLEAVTRLNNHFMRKGE